MTTMLEPSEIRAKLAGKYPGFKLGGKVQDTVVRLLGVDRNLTSGELTLLDAVSEES